MECAAVGKQDLNAACLRADAIARKERHVRGRGVRLPVALEDGRSVDERHVRRRIRGDVLWRGAAVRRLGPGVRRHPEREERAREHKIPERLRETKKAGHNDLKGELDPFVKRGGGTAVGRLATVIVALT